jgi:hypothetical protein
VSYLMVSRDVGDDNIELSVMYVVCKEVTYYSAS